MNRGGHYVGLVREYPSEDIALGRNLGELSEGSHDSLGEERSRQREE